MRGGRRCSSPRQRAPSRRVSSRPQGVGEDPRRERAEHGMGAGRSRRGRATHAGISPSGKRREVDAGTRAGSLVARTAAGGGSAAAPQSTPDSFFGRRRVHARRVPRPPGQELGPAHHAGSTALSDDAGVAPCVAPRAHDENSGGRAPIDREMRAAGQGPSHSGHTRRRTRTAAARHGAGRRTVTSPDPPSRRETAPTSAHGKRGSRRLGTAARHGEARLRSRPASDARRQPRGRKPASECHANARRARANSPQHAAASRHRPQVDRARRARAHARDHTTEDRRPAPTRQSRCAAAAADAQTRKTAGSDRATQTCDCRPPPRSCSRDRRDGLEAHVPRGVRTGTAWHVDDLARGPACRSCARTQRRRPPSPTTGRRRARGRRAPSRRRRARAAQVEDDEGVLERGRGSRLLRSRSQVTPGARPNAVGERSPSKVHTVTDRVAQNGLAFVETRSVGQTIHRSRRAKSPSPGERTSEGLRGRPGEPAPVDRRAHPGHQQTSSSKRNWEEPRVATSVWPLVGTPFRLVRRESLQQVGPGRSSVARAAAGAPAETRETDRDSQADARAPSPPRACPAGPQGPEE